MPKASIVIRCYNEERFIVQLLDGIMQQTEKNFEIIVVDSGSTDNTLTIVSRYPVKIEYISPADFSFGHALNIGCNSSSGEFIVAVSAHVYPVHRDWLEKLLAPFEDSRMALVYGRQLGNSITKYSEHCIFAKWFSEYSNGNQRHPFCNNANAAVRRSVWETFNYDETLTGLEDIAWAEKALSKGYRIAYQADADIIHVHDESFKSVYNRYRREAIALKKILPNERFNLWDFLRLFIINAISDYFHAVFDGVFWRNLFTIFKFRLVQFWGTYRGFAQRGPVPDELRRTFYYPNFSLDKNCDLSKKTIYRPTIDYSKHEGR